MKTTNLENRIAASEIPSIDGDSLKTLSKCGNGKLPKSTLIFNMGTAFDCPSAKSGQCAVRDICYALKAEIAYKAVYPYRQRQSQYWQSISASDFIDEVQSLSAVKRGKVKHLRFNESGDISNQDEVYKVAEIAKGLSAIGIQVYIYTARTDLDLSPIIKSGAGLNLSNDSTIGGNRFKVVSEFSDKGLKCKADCTKCQLCTVTHGKVIEVLAH